MFVMFLAMLLAILALPCILVPEAVWKTFNAGDDSIDYALRDINLVVLSMYFPCNFRHLGLRTDRDFSISPGNPVRDNGPPVCMAKLIMLRHKVGYSGLDLFTPHSLLPAQINQVGQKRRKASLVRHTRGVSRPTNIPQRPRAFSWMKFGKQMH